MNKLNGNTQNQNHHGKKHRIHHLGKKFDTDFLYPLSAVKCDKLRKEFYSKPELHDVINALIKIRTGGTSVSVIMKYFIYDLLYDTVLHHSNWSINEFMECDDLIRHAWARIQLNKKVYYLKENSGNLETLFRLGSKGLAAKPTNYPIKSVDYILDKYKPKNNNYYDPSCGWGIRLLSSMRNRVNYFGTDPNDKLFDRLKDIHKFYDAANNVISNVDIRCQGSEVYVPEWKNKMGLVFTSPPYFGLEDYKTGDEQSFKLGMNYQNWLDNFMKPTIDNATKYLIDGGYVLINISDYKKYKLFDDTKKICYSNNRLEFVEDLELEINKRLDQNGNPINKNEQIMVFKRIN